MNEITSAQDALEASASKDNLKDIASSMADYTLDNILEIGGGIPFISYLTKFTKASLSIRDFLFMEKVVEFLIHVGDEPTASRQKMIEDINNDSKYRDKFGKVSLIALERFEDVNKAKYLGKAACYLSRNEITFDLYKRLSFIINRLFTDDLLSYANSYNTKVPMHLKTELEALGLLTSKIQAKDEPVHALGRNVQQLSVKNIYDVTDVGRCLKDIILDRTLGVDYKRPETPLKDFNE
ncbi:MAG: hypothetical protein EOO43_09120 [Flavobacterium sp.]|nr:MAG: hypothetical protein EOO43_09120 [Flavobacterium sp.]